MRLIVYGNNVRPYHPVVATCLQRMPYLSIRSSIVPIAIFCRRSFSPPPPAPLRYTYVPCHRALLPSSDMPLRLLHSFSPAADLSISSHSLFLLVLPLLLPRLLSLSCALHSALLLSLSVHSLRPPNQLFFLPVTVQISIPETPRGRWGCGPFVCARQCLSKQTDNGPYRYWVTRLNCLLRNKLCRSRTKSYYDR